MRPPTDTDLPMLVDIAREGGSPDADVQYLRYVAAVGRVRVADVDARPVGFAAAVPVGEAWMVTDLFVDGRHREVGVGGRLLAAVLDGARRRMTCSSTHPGALAAYARAGLTPRWRLLTLRSAAGGGGRPAVEEPWRHDRPGLVEYFRSRGAVVASDHVTLSTPILGTVLRAVGTDHAAVLGDALDTLPAGISAELSVAEHHPAAAWLIDKGFEIADHDVFCSTDGLEPPSELIALHRGLL